jgi:hypothetical protein
MIYFKQAKIGPLVGTRTWGAQNERIASDIDVEITDVTRSSNAPYRKR